MGQQRGLCTVSFHLATLGHVTVMQDIRGNPFNRASHVSEDFMRLCYKRSEMRIKTRTAEQLKSVPSIHTREFMVTYNSSCRGPNTLSGIS